MNVISEFPKEIVVKVVSRQSRLLRNRSRNLFDNSEVVPVTFDSLVRKERQNIIAIRGSIGAQQDVVLSQFIEMGGGSIEDEDVEVDIIATSEKSHLDKIFDVIQHTWSELSVSVLGEDLRFHQIVDRTSTGRIILPIVGEEWSFTTISGQTYMVRSNVRDLFGMRIQHIAGNCSKPCCNNEDGKIPVEVLRTRVAESLGVVIHGKNLMSNHFDHFKETQDKKTQMEYLRRSQRDWRDMQKIGTSFGHTFKSGNETRFQALKPGPGARNWTKFNQFGDPVNEEGELDLEMLNHRDEENFVNKKKKKKKRATALTLPFSSLRVNEMVSQAQEIEGHVVQVDDDDDVEGDPTWLPNMGKKNRDDEYEEDDDIEIDDEELVKLHEEAVAPLVDLYKGMNVDLVQHKAATFAAGVANLYKHYNNGSIQSMAELQEEIAQYHAKVERGFGVLGGTRAVDAETETNGSLTSGGMVPSVQCPGEGGLMPLAGSLTSNQQPMGADSGSLMSNQISVVPERHDNGARDQLNEGFVETPIGGGAGTGEIAGEEDTIVAANENSEPVAMPRSGRSSRLSGIASYFWGRENEAAAGRGVDTQESRSATNGAASV